jgi:hypothetical protein
MGITATGKHVTDAGQWARTASGSLDAGRLSNACDPIGA